MQSYVSNVTSAIADLQGGRMIIIIDHEDRENEGDLVCPAETVTPEKMSFIIRNTGGIVCLALTMHQFKKLELSYMVPPHQNDNFCQTPFTVSIEAKHGVTTGVSAADRATTILTAIDDNVSSADIVKPGHVFPLLAKENGVFERQGHTEASVDLMRLAGLKPAAVISEVTNVDSSIAKGEDLKKFAVKNNIRILSIEDIINYRLLTENLIQEEVSSQLPLEHYGNLQISIVKERITNTEQIIISKPTSLTPLVRIHSSCVTGDIFGCRRCDCNKQLHYSLQKISKEGGMLIYLNQEGRGIGLFNKIKAYALQETGMDTVEANIFLGLPIDAREYYIVANILRQRNIKHIRLLTNNPMKKIGLQKYGISKVEVEALPTFSDSYNQAYLETKKNKLNHTIS